MMETIHIRVIRGAEDAIEDARERGMVDFGRACGQVLALEDGIEKARALARLAGFALWYADQLQREKKTT